MGNSILNGVYKDTVVINPIKPSKVKHVTDIANIVNASTVDSLNNYPLGTATSYTQPIITIVTPLIDSLLNRNFKITYESLYQNIASYPYTLDMVNKLYLVKTYTLPNGGVITQTTDMTVPNIITTTIDGNTGYTSPLVKTVTIATDKNSLNTVYS